MPALRLVVVTNLIAEATLLVFHVAPLLIRKHVRRWRLRRQAQPALPSQGEQLEAGPCATSASPAEGGVGIGSGSEQGSADASPKAGQASVAACCHTAVRLADPPPRAAEGDAEGQEKQQPASPQPHTQPRPSTAKSSVRAPVPLLRGLTRRVDRWERERPLLRRRLALAAITITFMGCCSLQILAPGFVDVSIGGAGGGTGPPAFDISKISGSAAEAPRRRCPPPLRASKESLGRLKRPPKPGPGADRLLARQRCRPRCKCLPCRCAPPVLNPPGPLCPLAPQ